MPAELIRHYRKAGYTAIAITDHVDFSNIESVIEAIIKFCSKWPKNSKLQVLPGVELTHLNLADFKPLSNLARKKGIKVIVGHGETLVEPVLKETNRAILEADVDILAHPGLISESDCKLAAKRNIFLEITSRKGHCLTNGHVAKMAAKLGAKLILNNDTHAPNDIISPVGLKNIGLGAGLSEEQIRQVYKDLNNLMRK